MKKILLSTFVVLLILGAVAIYCYFSVKFLDYFIVSSVTFIGFLLLYIVGFLQDVYNQINPKKAENSNPSSESLEFSDKPLTLLDSVYLSKISANNSDWESVVLFLQHRCVTPNVLMGNYLQSDVENLFNKCYTAVSKNLPDLKEDFDNPFKDFELGHSEN